jgi:hypothetical protein
MPVIDTWNLLVDADDVLRGQGADPSIIRVRRPKLYDIAVQALEEGFSLVHPVVQMERYRIDSFFHHQINLSRGGKLNGELLVEKLVKAKEIVVILCTIGPQLEERVEQVMADEIVHGLALYGVGSAAVEALANSACQYIETEAAQRGWQSTIPLSPGMIGWDVAEGQSQLFALLDASQIGVWLSEASVMLPRKSLSMVIGLGADLDQQGVICDYCAMKEVCKYRTHIEGK